MDSDMNLEKTIICGEVSFDSFSLLETKLLTSTDTCFATPLPDNKRSAPIGGLAPTPDAKKKEAEAEVTRMCSIEKLGNH